MAIYHLSVKPVKRGEGRSATAAAAYRAGECVEDRTTGQTFDYTRKQGVEHAEIVLPTAAAKQDVNWARDRQQLWNAAEAAEKRKDARVAREYEVALPHELKASERLELVRAFALEVANRYGVAVDFAIHAPHRDGDQRNHHAHVLTTTRQVTPTGLGAKAAVELGDRDRAKIGLGTGADEMIVLRERWAALTNDHLQARGHDARVDHRTLEAQGIARDPSVHVGPAVTALERRGINSEVGYRLQAEAAERLERASELGRLEREGQGLRQEILVLSTDLAAAKRDREAREPGRAQTPSPDNGRGPSEAARAGPGVDAQRVRAAAVDEWLAARHRGRSEQSATTGGSRGASSDRADDRERAGEGLGRSATHDQTGLDRGSGLA